MTHPDQFNLSSNSRDLYGRTPTVAAIMEDDERFMGMLQMGADPNLYSTVSFHGRFDMEWAVRMQACQNVNLIAITPLHAALIRGRTDFIDSAVSFGGNMTLPALGAVSPGNNEIFRTINNLKRKHQGNAYIEIEPMDSSDLWLESVFPSYSDQLKIPRVSNITGWIRFLVRLCEDPSLACYYSRDIIQVTADELSQSLPDL